MRRTVFLVLADVAYAIDHALAASIASPLPCFAAICKKGQFESIHLSNKEERMSGKETPHTYLGCSSWTATSDLARLGKCVPCYNRQIFHDHSTRHTADYRKTKRTAALYFLCLAPASYAMGHAAPIWDAAAWKSPIWSRQMWQKAEVGCLVAQTRLGTENGKQHHIQNCVILSLRCWRYRFEVRDG